MRSASLLDISIQEFNIRLGLVRNGFQRQSRIGKQTLRTFQKQHGAQLRIFISEHTWKGGQPTEEEASMILNQGDESSVPVPAVFMFVPGMPVVVNRNTYRGLKLVNGARYTALEVILDEKHPGHRVSADTIIHFGPPAGILLASETTNDRTDEY